MYRRIKKMINFREVNEDDILDIYKAIDFGEKIS